MTTHPHLPFVAVVAVVVVVVVVVGAVPGLLGPAAEQEGEGRSLDGLATCMSFPHHLAVARDPQGG